MDIIVEYIVVACLSLLSVLLYVTLMTNVYPRHITRLRCSYNENMGRGLKKYVYPEGRGILYEPYPSARKYVRHYLLFTAEGYKYFKCSLDNAVRKIGYSVVMMNNRSEIIDVLTVKETIGTKPETDSLLLHPDTSYVAFTLNSVGNRTLINSACFHYTVRSLLAYAVAVTVTSYLFISFVGYAVLKFCGKNTESFLRPLGRPMLICLVFSVLIGYICTRMLVSFAKKKGVKVVK